MGYFFTSNFTHKINYFFNAQHEAIKSGGRKKLTWKLFLVLFVKNGQNAPVLGIDVY